MIHRLLDQADILLQQGRIGDAWKCCEQILMADGSQVDGLRLAAAIQTQWGHPEKAIVYFRQVLQAQPQHVETRYEFGKALYVIGQIDEALECFEHCLRIAPDNAEAHNARGIMLSRLKRVEEAIDSFSRAVALQPSYVSAHNNLGNELFHAKRYDAALASFRRAAEIQPDFPDATIGLGSVYLAQKNFDEALACFDRALALDDGLPDAWSGRGYALFSQGKLNDALGAHERATMLDPDVESEWHGDVLLMLGRQEEAIRAYRRYAEQNLDAPDRLSYYLFTLNYLDGISLEESFARHKEFGERYETPLKVHWRPHRNVPDPERKIRLGFVSADLRNHSVGIFIEEFFRYLPNDDRQELFAYANQKKSDELTEKLRTCFAGWRDISGMSDEAAAEQIRSDGIDVLVDLSGHTPGNRLLVFARKPAPVQASYLGYYATTGLTAMDYFIGDRWQMPENEMAPFTETPFCTSGHHLCFTPPDLDLPVGSLPALRNGYVTFANFGNMGKTSDAAVACWAAILRAVPGSRLFLKSGALDSEDGRNAVIARFARQGIGSDRLILEARSPLPEYFSRYQQVDIHLDSFPLVGGTVTMQSLWMGVPVLTLYGDRHCARNGGGIMHELDLPEWVTYSQADYVSRAVSLAGDVSALAALRAGLRERLLASPLCDGRRFAQDLANSFRTMWRNWCAQQRC